MIRLSRATARLAYDPSLTDVGIVHLGVGAFHRAHQVAYTDRVLAQGDRRWAILGASLQSPATRDALAPQDYLYTLAESNQQGEHCRVIGALRGVLVAPENPQALVEAMCLPSVKIVSLTVTEKGYCHDPASGALDESHPAILRDLADPHRPTSAPGFLVEAIRARKARGLPPFTVLCCDNLPAKGRTVARVAGRLAQLRSAELGRYVAENIAFPATMVDRIVPATTDADRARLAAATGLEDACPVVTEAFTDWVIEDHFPQGRPDWAARFVSDIAPFETMKLRLLNGAHSAMAYLGSLAGHETVADCMADAGLAAFLARLMDQEVTPTLAVPPGTDVSAYKRALLQRFRNPGLRHRCRQIAMDGSQKLPQRLLGTIRDRLQAGAPITALALAVAGWMRYAAGVDEKGQPIDLSDPLAEELRTRAAAAGLDAGRLAPALFGIEKIFGRDLAADPRFTAPVTAALDSLIRHGSRNTYGRMHS